MFRKLHSNNQLPDILRNGYVKNVDNNLKTILFGAQYPSFEECINLEFEYMNKCASFLEPSFIRRGLYSEQIERYYKYFDKNQFLFLDYNDFENNLAKVLNLTTQFLELKEFEANKIIYEIANKGVYQTSKPKIYSELYSFYKPYNERLFDLINMQFAWK
jgi:DNA primase large subunit